MRISVNEAARLMGVSPQFVRIGMQRGKLPIGTCVKMSSKWTYFISPALFEQFTGIKKPSAGTEGSSEAEQEGQGDYIK